MPRLLALTCLLLFAPVNGRGDDAPFWKRHAIDASSRGADGVRPADVNGDGLPDLVTGWEEGGRIRAYLHPRQERVRQPWPAVTVGEVGSPEDAVFVDLDGDGAVDVVSCCEGRTRAMHVHWAPREPAEYLDPAAWRTQELPASRGQLWMFCLPLQVDGERGVDLIAGSKGEGAQVGWWESPADPRRLEEWQWHPIREAGWLMSLFAEDMDGDGDLDVLVTDRKGRNRGCWRLENPGRGAVQRQEWAAHEIGGAGREMMFMVPADLDADGLLDVVAAAKPRQILVFRRTRAHPAAWETIPVAMPAEAGTAKGVQVGDIDLDGGQDLVLTCEGAEGKSGVMWLSREEGKPIAEADWTAHDISGPEQGIKFDLIQLIDLDGDGDLDVLTCEERDNLGVIWYENPVLP